MYYKPVQNSQRKQSLKWLGCPTYSPTQTKSSFTKLIMNDMLGREVTNPVNEQLQAGTVTKEQIKNIYNKAVDDATIYTITNTGTGNLQFGGGANPNDMGYSYKL
jgi:hypothetical protein